MRPSERINEIAQAEIARIRAEGGVGGIDSAACFLGAIAKHLDEQSELERRRRAVQWAVLFARSNDSYDYERAVHWISQAGLDVPCPVLRGLWWHDVTRAAEREGLL
jgi:hypothetical protein